MLDLENKRNFRKQDNIIKIYGEFKSFYFVNTIKMHQKE